MSRCAGCGIKIYRAVIQSCSDCGVRHVHHDNLVCIMDNATDGRRLQGIRSSRSNVSFSIHLQVPVADDDFAQAEKTGTRLYKIWGTDRSAAAESLLSLALTSADWCQTSLFSSISSTYGLNATCCSTSRADKKLDYGRASALIYTLNLLYSPEARSGSTTPPRPLV
jgi:hypothetical protein